ncbi:MAG: type II secretion system F family protein [Firmicutes bacterium]|nr:type II secretion system F family protein [Bacillota bacterium]
MKESFLTRELRLPFGKPYLRTRDLMIFCRYFATLIEAGIMLHKSLLLLEKQTEHKLLKERIKDVAARVERGYSLTESLRANSDVFPEFFINMAAAGEAGGFLGDALQKLALYFEKQYELEQKIRSATMYPKFIACAALVVVVFMITAILPAFATIFESMGIEMPILTRLLISAGNLLVFYWYIFLIVVVAILIFGRGLLKSNRGRLLYDILRLRNPFFGTVYRKTITARFCRTLGALLENGIAMLPALDLVGKIMENSIYEKNIYQAKEKIIQGYSLAAALSGVKLFPSLVVEMCNVGEQTGHLEEMLVRTANFLETEVSHSINRLSAMIEPLLILFMAGIIIIIALSVILPMFEMYRMI